MDRKKIGILNILSLVLSAFLFSCVTSQQEEESPVGGSGFYYEKEEGSEPANLDQENSQNEQGYNQEDGYGEESGDEFDITSENSGNEFDDNLNFADVDGSQGGDNQGYDNPYGSADNTPYQGQNAQNPNEMNAENLAMNSENDDLAGEMVDQELPEVPGDLGPQLWWLGYDLQKDENRLNVELITLGTPTFELNQEFNQSGQPELVVKFQDTKLRKKLKRSLDTSEFLSPVAYIRTRYIESSNVSEVILTLRDQVKPELFSEDGNVLLTFAIPEKYQGNFEITAESEGQAELLASTDITPLILEGSVSPGQSPFKEEKQVVESLEEEVMPEPEESMVESEEILEEEPSENGNDTYSDANEDNLNSYGSDNATQNEADPYGESDSYNQNDNNNYDDNNNENNNNNENYNDNNGESDENYNDENNDNNENYNDQNEASHAGDLFRNYVVVHQYHIAAVSQDNGYEEEGYEEGQGGYENSGGQYENSGGGYEEGDDVFDNSLGSQFDGQENLNGGQYDDNLSNELFNDQVGQQSGQYNQNNGMNQNTEDNGIDLSGEETIGMEDETEVKTSRMQPVSMEFKGATLKEVIRTFSLENSVNFIFPEEIGNEKVYLNFNNVPWDQALQAILETHSLGLTKLSGNVVRIDSLKTLDQEKKDLEKVRESASHIIPTKVLVVRLSYAKAEDVAKVVKTMLESQSHDKRTKVEADARTNSVIVEAIPAALSKIKALVTRVDLQTPQVKIDTRIIEVTSSNNLQLGINWATPMRSDQSRGLGFGSLAFPNQIYSAFSVDTGIDANSTSDRTSVDLHLGSINNLFELDVRLRMAERQEQIKSLQNNSVVVLDNEKAETKVGQVVYHTIPVGNGQDKLSSVEYTLMLNVKPHITADGAIQMEIEIEHSSAAPNQTKTIPDKNMRKLQTKLLRENGQTAVIGGIYRTEYTENYLGVPVLSQLPLLGVLFRSTTYDEQKRELIVMVTPTVINSAKSLSETGSVDKNSLGSNFANANSNAYSNNAYQTLNQDGSSGEMNDFNNFGNQTTGNSQSAANPVQGQGAENSGNYQGQSAQGDGYEEAAQGQEEAQEAPQAEEGQGGSQQQGQSVDSAQGQQDQQGGEDPYE